MKLYHYSDHNLEENMVLAAGNFSAGFSDEIFMDLERNRQIKVAMWYPALQQARKIIYRDLFEGKARQGAKIAAGYFPLILISHGSEGHRFNQHYLAEYLACHGYIIAAVEHPGDNAMDNAHSRCSKNLEDRPQDINFVINALRDHAIHIHMDISKIGFAGHSYGGYTGLMLAGASYEKPNTITSKTLNLSNSNIRCYFLMAPATGFYDLCFNQIQQPIALVFSDRDEFLQRDNCYFQEKLLSVTTEIHFNNAGHYIYLMRCNESIRSLADSGCDDIGTKRELVHPLLKKHILMFMNENLDYGQY